MAEERGLVAEDRGQCRKQKPPEGAGWELRAETLFPRCWRASWVLCGRN